MVHIEVSESLWLSGFGFKYRDSKIEFSLATCALAWCSTNGSRSLRQDLMSPVFVLERTLQAGLSFV